jgi:predicted nucleotidyltransferase
MKLLDRIIRDRIATRRRRAIDIARAATRELEEKGHGVLVFGSLARGNFGNRSDLDLLLDSPKGRELEAVAIILRHARDFPFDVAFLSDLTEDLQTEFKKEARHASSFGPD